MTSGQEDNTWYVFSDFLLSGDRNNCRKLVFEQISCLPVKTVYESVIRPALYRIGELWEFNKISVASEHLASAIVESIMNEIYPQIVSQVKKEKNIVLACLENEFHQIGIKMVNDIFEMNGWNTHFLGANTPARDLLAHCRKTNPEVIGLSLSIYYHMPAFNSLIESLNKNFPETKIIVGGQAFSRSGKEILRNHAKTDLIENLEFLEKYILNYR